MRSDGRTSTQMRPIRIQPNFTSHPAGSVLIEYGETRVLCTACVEDSVPHWMRQQAKSAGWLTAEYSMLPGSTHTRSRRERGHLGGRTQEIQRLIGRSLRGIIDLKKIPEMTIQLDCDVLQADGGTRTAAITGAYVALRMAVNHLLRLGKIKADPITGAVAGVSVGVSGDQLLVDLNYEEDSTIDLDMNVVMTQDNRILEIQGTAEKESFTKEQVISIIDVAGEALEEIFEKQNLAIEGQTVEI